MLRAVGAFAKLQIEECMKKHVVKFALVGAMIILLSTCLVACGLFNAQKAITKIDVVVTSGLENGENGGEYVAHIGEDMVLSANWHNIRVTKADVAWHVVVDGKDVEIEGATEKNYTRSFTKDDLDKKFEFYVVANGLVKSQKISVTIEVAALSAPSLTANLPIASGIIQQNIISGIEDVTLGVSWNRDELADDTVVSVAWFVDDEKQTTTEESFTYGVGGIADECEVTIKVELTDGEQTTSASVVLVFVKQYAPTDSVAIVADDTLTEICDGTYYFKSSLNGDKTKSFSISLLPLNANQGAACEWTLSNAGGTSVVGESKRDADVALAYGKNVLKATVENVASRQIIVYALEYDVNSIPENVKKHIQNKFLWLGNYYDGYITSQADLDAYIGYAVSKHDSSAKYEMYVANSDWCNNSVFGEKVSKAFDEGVDESGSFAYSTSTNGAIGTVTFSDDTVFGIPSGAYSPKAESEQIVGYLRYSEQTQTRDVLPIDKASESVTVSDSNELYRAVSCGYKPIFENDEDGEALEQLYEKARDVLETYVTDDMSEYDKVAAIYDWIVNVVDYDYAVAASKESGASKYNAFYLEGVFNDHRAVCDGKSKAFALLCGMEGIKAMRIVGNASSDKNPSAMTEDELRGCGHAWNKVLIDANNDGVREWYVVDTTWGDLAVKSKGTDTIFEYLNYAYFLKTDADIATTHLAKTSTPAATTTFDVYKNTLIVVDGVTMDLYVETKAERLALLQYSKENGCISLSVYILPAAQSDSDISIGANQYVIYAKTSTSEFGF